MQLLQSMMLMPLADWLAIAWLYCMSFLFVASGAAD